MKTWAFEDKKDWRRGAWDEEPDKAHWVDSTTGLDCLIVRGGSGALCGYVGVPESNSECFGKDYDDVDVDVHGGLTFSSACQERINGICHAEEDAANNTVWWLSFDCAHGGDLSPRHSYTLWSNDTYKNFEYVKHEVEKLALQLNHHA